ncbi:MAG: Ig-like domain-containing protein [Blastocatellia bacterium]
MLLTTATAQAGTLADNDFAPVTVSAASYESAAIAPDAIVAAFGTKLATGVFAAEDADQATAGLQLPTSLGGTTVRVNGQAAGLFFVSPNQVNYVIPTGTVSGTATVQITSGDGTVSTGTVQIAQVAPGIFSGNADGQGVPAAYLVRVRADGSLSNESVSQLSNGRQVTKPIDLGPEGEHVFLVLFASGISHASDPNSDNNLSENIRVVLGGSEVAPAFAGRQGYFVGLDQINVEIPRSLIGRGRVSLAIAATGFSSSRLCEIEIASPAGSAPPQVSGFSTSSALAGQTLTITGSGFSTTASDNTVRISGSEATVTSVTPTEIAVQVPYGAESGPVSVRTPQGEGTSSSLLAMRTSVSGFVEDTNRQPMSGVTVKITGTNKQVTTNSEGLFVLPDVSSGAALIEIDAQSVTSPPFPKVTLKMAITASRDNQFTRPVSLQQATGASLPVGSGSHAPQSVSVPFAAAQHSGKYRTNGSISNGNVTFDLPAGTAVFPDGATSGTLYLTLLDNSRTPVDLPGGYFSTAIAQISPFNVSLNPGGRLSFPNPENWAAGSAGTLFRFEQDPNSSSVGRFVEAGTAQVSSDGQRIETADGAITRTGIYFVSRLRQTTTVAGRVFDNDGTTPVRHALVRTRGQETFTDGNGGFIIRSVPVKAGETISVEASFLRPNGRVDRKQSAEVPVVVGGITNITPDIVLPAPAINRPPVIQAPATFTIDEGQNIDLRIAAFDPDAGQTITLSLTGPGFATLIESTEKLVRLTPGFNDAGTYTLTLTAKDDQNATTTRTIALTVNNTNRPPSGSGQSLTTNEDTAVQFTASGSDPDGDTITFIPVSSPLHGVVTGTPPNGTYTPSKDYNGTDSFSFKISDGKLESPVYTVSITINPVNDAPTAGGQNITINEDQAKPITLTGSDADGDTITFVIVSGPAKGTLSGTAPNLTYTPNANYNGTDSFTFKANDGKVDSAIATVGLTINPVNDPPVANGQSVTASEDTARTVTLTATDVDGDTLTWAVVTQPQHGTLSGTAPNLTYTPATNYNGADSFTFKVNDGKTDSSVATVSITVSPVNDAPVANGQSLTISEDQAKPISLTGSDVDGDTLSFTVVNAPAHGTLTGTAPNLTYTPATNYNGTDSFTFKANDGKVDSAVATISLTINPVNDPPVANGQSVTTAEDTPKAITLTGSDVEGSALTFSIVSGPAKGSLSGTLPNVTYTPNANYNGADSFTFKVNDGQADSAVATVSITVSAVNDPPVAGSQTLNVNEDTPISFTLTGADIEGSALTFTVLSNPASGTLSGTAPNLTYTPNLNFNGTDSFTFKVNDGQADSAAATITLNVQPVNDAPTINVPGQQTIFTEDLLSFTISGADVDAGQSLTFSVMNLPPGANFDPAQKKFTWVPAWNQVGTYDVDFKVQDNFTTPAAATGRVRIVVNPVLNWTQNAGGPEGGEIFGLVGDPGMLLAGTFEGIFKSTDDGASWFNFNNNLPPGGPVNSFAGSASNGFISRHGTGPNDGVWHTTDGGASWTRASNGLPSTVYINALMMNGTTLLAATDNGIYRSTNNGGNWAASGAGLQGSRVTSFGLDNTTVFAGTDQGISVSTDDGVTWSSVNAGLPQPPLNIPAFYNSGSRLFAAVNESVFEIPSGGQTWINDGFGLPRSSAVTSLAQIGSQLFAGTKGFGVYSMRLDTTPYWTPASNGLRNQDINALIAIGPDLYAGTFGGGVWKSTDSGLTWASATTGINQSRPRCFAQIGSTMFAGTTGNGIFSSTDGGQTWASVNNNLSSWEITALAASGSELYAGTYGQGLWLSRDNGTSWQMIEIEYTSGMPITSIVATTSDLYVATPIGVIKSPLASYSFTLMISGLTDIDVRALAATATDLYAATGSGIFRSSDGAQTWTLAGDTTSGLTNADVSSLTADANNVYAGTAGGVFKMPITGGNWTAINNGITNPDVQAVVSYSGKLFAATSGGVFFSTDGGAKWKNGSYNLFNQNVKALFVSGAKVCAGTDGSAAWSSSY